MKTKLHPICFAAALTFFSGCSSVHWGDYFNAGGGPPEPSSTLPTKAEATERPVEEPGQRRSLR